ncbi:MAG TPA: HD domain-containing protein, partial [Candidatus Methylomirabilis sp.]|nr:HD domain-containing protein [Candidatus Methylomirabilis sp.]
MRSEKLILKVMRAEVSGITENIPPSHGAPHLFKVSEIAGYLARVLEVKPFLPCVAGLLHDLRFYNEEERRMRKIKISEKHAAKKSAGEILDETRDITPEEKRAVLDAIEHHSELPQGNEAPLLLKVLRDADRLSRQGYGGVHSLLSANQFYGVPFYLAGGEILWDPARPLLANENIKSCVDDIHACLGWFQIMETVPGKLLFSIMARVNIRFLEYIYQRVRTAKPEQNFYP